MPDAAEAEIFTCSLADNALYADTAVARLFGLDPKETLLGMSPAAYLARVHAEDRANVAGLWMKAVADGLPYSGIYRVIGAAGAVRHVIAHGRCFRDRAGTPAHYAGIVYPWEGQFQLYAEEDVGRQPRLQ
ncbi:PAS domain-containing protein [Rhizobium lusitanum]|uniref:PAS domain-containing protein n=1 Tax=Rhizobium lusitanum TaxID=293958 RepID=A0A6L9UF22_9HYPH|nr:PAS domain-containing protein [Rhizobium lusitanum]NEI74603.1 PAS domain-containing protein [Rhizobium lusitanum]